MYRSALGVVIALLAVACTPISDDGRGASGPTASTAASTTTAPEPVPPCGADGYITSGPITRTGTSQGDAAQILGISITRVGSCERVEVEFTTRGGAPATRLGPAQIEWLEDLNVTRVSFGPDIQSTALADTVLEGDLTERAYVVRGLDGTLFIDIVVGAPAAVRAEVTRSPARLLLEFREETEAAETPPIPSIGNNVVVTIPTGEEAKEPLTVAGYARTPEGRVVGHILDTGGLIDERVTTAAAYIETWGAFQLIFEALPDRPFELRVGGDAAAGDAVTLILRPS